MARSARLRLASVCLGAALTGVVAVAARASSSPQLPVISPRALLASVIRAATTNGPPVSGRVTAHLDLGLPSLPDALAGRGPAGLGSLVSELSGDHRFRIWSSADGVRIAELLPAAERSVIASRTDAWAWNSTTFTAYHLGSLPKLEAPSLSTPQVPAIDLVDPQRLAERALAAVDPTTAVSVGPTARIAGRASYVLVLEPRSSGTLVGRIEIGIDAERRVPLSVTVFPAGSPRAAIRVAFTSVGFGSIDPTVFRFTPPAGATVLTPSHPTLGAEGSESRQVIAPSQHAIAPNGAPQVFGTAWSSVVAIPLTSIADLRQSEPGKALAGLLPFSGRVFSVRLIDRGDHAWLVVGFVPQSSLVAAGSELP